MVGLRRLGVFPFQTIFRLPEGKNANTSRGSKKTREPPTHAVNRNRERNILKGLAVVDDGDHVLDVALRKLTIFQVLLLVRDGLVPVPETHSETGPRRFTPDRKWVRSGNSAAV